MKQPDDIMMSPNAGASKGIQIRSDIFYYTNNKVNIVMIGNPAGGKWILVDTGMPGFSDQLLDIVAERFPHQNRPSAILLTHAHFDHVGNITDLIERWQVPVYAHPSEFVYLSGQRAYTDQAKLLRRLSTEYPYHYANILSALVPLPDGGAIPDLPGWKWMHTPGHSPGHVSLFRESDRILIAGDAFVTVRMDPFYKVIIPQSEINGPPSYFTTDWDDAFHSVKKIEALNPEVAITGHGPAMGGDELRNGLRELVDEFYEIAVPKYGKIKPLNHK